MARSAADGVAHFGDPTSGAQYRKLAMPKNEFCIEQTSGGKYNVSRPKSKPVASAKMQAEAIKRARRLDPEATLRVEWVRNVGPGRDKWRKL